MVLLIGDFGTKALQFLRGLIQKVVVREIGETMDADLYVDYFGLMSETTRASQLTGSNHMVAGARITRDILTTISDVVARFMR